MNESLQAIDNDAHGWDSGPGHTESERADNRKRALAGAVVCTTVERSDPRGSGKVREFFAGALSIPAAARRFCEEHRRENFAGKWTILHVYAAGTSRTRVTIYSGDSPLGD